MLKNKIIVGKDVVATLPELIQKANIKKPFIVADKNTYKAAGENVCSLLAGAEIVYSLYVIDHEMPEPDEYTVGSVMMHFDKACDLVVGIGSGVINDVCKILSNISGTQYYIVATAPSMDGYASATSSMSRDGLKISLPSKSADVIIGDIEILKSAPDRMLLAGLGDMLAKYISICDWRIAHIVTGEYYSEEIAQMVRDSLKRCVDHASGLLKREDAAIKAVFEGLVNTGLAMALAGVSRPASGVEHYFSHIWDMRGLEFGTRVDLHGIQCGTATLLSIKLFEQIKQMKPDREKALAYAESFNFTKWSETLRELLGKGAEAMIALEAKEQKYDLEKHKVRLEAILAHWEDIVAVMEEELPKAQQLEQLLLTLNAPTTVEEIGQKNELLPLVFMATKDIRDKYVLSRLAWDLGVIEELPSYL